MIMGEEAVDLDVSTKSAASSRADCDSGAFVSFGGFPRNGGGNDGATAGPTAAVVGDDDGGAAAVVAPTATATSNNGSNNYQREDNRLAPFNPSNDRTQLAILNMLQLTSSDVLFDLGCGDGRFLIRAAAAVTQEVAPGGGGLRCVGIEYDEKFASRAAESVKNLASASDRDRIEIRHGDLLDHGSATGLGAASTGNRCCRLTLVDATAVYVFLLPQGLLKVKPILDELVTLKRERNEGLKVVAYMFQIKGWEPTRIDRTSTKSQCPIYLYDFPPAKAKDGDGR